MSRSPIWELESGVRRGEAHGFLDSECGWIGDRLSPRFYAHGLSGGETAQGHRYPRAWLQIRRGNERIAHPGDMACVGGAPGRRAERVGGARLGPLVFSLAVRTRVVSGTSVSVCV